MNVKNPWVTYVSRSYRSIKASVINRLKVQVPELQDYSPSNLLMVIVDIFAGIGELINYYIDATARELFLPTAKRFSSLLKIANAVNYTGKAKLAATATVTFYAKDSGGDTIINPTTFSIPAGTELEDTVGNIWETLNTQEFRSGFTNVSTAVKQQISPTGTTGLGTSDGSSNQAYELPYNYMHDTLEITIDAVNWSRVDSFQFSNTTSKDFMVNLKSDGKVYVEFGDGNNGEIPNTGSSILGAWKTTNGSAGQVAENTITTINSSLTLPGGVDHLDVTNQERAYGGKELEGIEDLRRSIPLSLYTLDRAVTRRDYEYVAALAPGVRYAFASFDCGPKIMLYIIGFEGGNPSASLLADIKTFVEARAIFSIPLDTAPSGEVRLKGIMNIKGTYRMTSSTITNAVNTALEELYSPYTEDPKKGIYKSDIVAAVDNLPEVDFLTLNSYYVVPYLRPSNLDTVIDATIETLQSSSQTVEWKLVYNGTSFSLLTAGAFVQTVLAGVQYNGILNLINLFIDSVPGNAISGDYWDFVTYPYSGDFVLIDYSIPVTFAGDFTLSITESYIK